MNFFSFPEPTPEQKAEAEKARRERNAKVDRTLRAALPFLHDAQKSLREAASLDCGGEHFEKAFRNLAVYIETVEIELSRTR